MSQSRPPSKSDVAEAVDAAAPHGGSGQHQASMQQARAPPVAAHQDAVRPPQFAPVVHSSIPQAAAVPVQSVPRLAPLVSPPAVQFHSSGPQALAVPVQSVPRIVPLVGPPSAQWGSQHRGQRSNASINAAFPFDAPPPLRHRANGAPEIPAARPRATSSSFEPPIVHRPAVPFEPPIAHRPAITELEDAVRDGQARAAESNLDAADESLDEDDDGFDVWEWKTEGGTWLVRYNVAGIPSEWMPATAQSEAARAQIGHHGMMIQ